MAKLYETGENLKKKSKKERTRRISWSFFINNNYCGSEVFKVFNVLKIKLHSKFCQGKK